MDVQLKELIEKIKTEGVENAEKKSAQIIGEAEKKAADMVKKAQEDSRKIIESAEAEAEKLKITGQEALKQAGRNLLLGLKEKIEKLYAKLVIEESAKALQGKNLESAIVNVVSSMKPDEMQNMSIMIDKKEIETIEKGLKGALSAALKSGLELKPVDSVAGFRLSEKDGSAYFNYTAAGVAEILCEYLNPRLSEILQEAIKEE